MSRLQDNASFLQALDSNGDSLSGALLKIYAAGTTTPVTTYSDAGLTSANAWPVVADASGRWPNVYIADGSHKVRIETSDGALVSEADNVRAGPLGGKVSQVVNENGTLVFEGEGIEDDFSPFVSLLGNAFKVTGEHTAGSGLPFIAVVDHQAPANTLAFPSAVTGYGRSVNDGNTIFGGFFRADLEGVSDGIAVGAELNCFNHGTKNADSDLFPSRAIGGGSLIPACIQIAAGYERETLASGVRRDSTYGVHVSSEGGSVVNSDGDRARFHYAFFGSEKSFRTAGLVLISDDELDPNAGRHVLLIDTQDDAATPPVLAMRHLRNAAIGNQAGDAGQAGDQLGKHAFEGNNASGELRSYAEIVGEIEDPTAASEDGKLEFRTRRGGVGPTEKMSVLDGLAVGGGSDRGTGTVNAVNGFYIGDTSWTRGTGSPEGIVTAPKGSIYSRTDGGAGTCWYVKESGTGNTGWVAK